ncbi:MAG: Jag N-terminal domain-containing protein [Clostridia bacterium]|nr:Jag N-terminal domain-containing protein [Clostridia bacterium]
MKQIEKTAKTYEEALESALTELNASISEVDVLTLEEGSKGLFGLFGSRPYKIRVTLKNSKDDTSDELDVMSLLAGDKPAKKEESKPEAKPEKKSEKKPKAEKRPEPKAEPSEAKADTAEEKKAETPEKKPARRPEPVRRVNPDRKPEPAPADEAETDEEPETEENTAENGEAPAHKRRRRHRGHGGSKKPAAEAEKSAEPKPLPPKPPAQPMEKPAVTMIPDEELDPESPAGRAKAFLQELTHLMGVDVTIDMGTDPEGNVFGYMNGDTLGILIGRRGETLDALQYLTSLKVNRGQENYTRVTLDTENYRAKREDTLIRLANRKANHAVKTGRRVILDPMNPYERRIVHSALQANEAVETHSEGEEPNRHVVITVRKA